MDDVTGTFEVDFDVGCTVEVTVLVVGVTIQEHALLMTWEGKGASAGGLYPSCEPLGGDHPRSTRAPAFGFVTVVVLG